MSFSNISTYFSAAIAFISICFSQTSCKPAKLDSLCFNVYAKDTVKPLGVYRFYKSGAFAFYNNGFTSASRLGRYPPEFAHDTVWSLRADVLRIRGVDYRIRGLEVGKLHLYSPNEKRRLTLVQRSCDDI
jgi:hypothetical protein